MNEYEELEQILSHGSAAAIDEAAAKYGLVRGLHPDACEDCQAGIYAGYDHPECSTLVPASTARY